VGARITNNQSLAFAAEKSTDGHGRFYIDRQWKYSKEAAASFAVGSVLKNKRHGCCRLPRHGGVALAGRLRRRVLSQGFERNKFQGAFVRREERHRRRKTRVYTLLPAGRAHAPAVTRLQPRKSILRTRRNEIVAGGKTELKKFCRNLHADRMAAVILHAGVAGARPEKTGERLL
jgi:hypothetical protein